MSYKLGYESHYYNFFSFRMRAPMNMLWYRRMLAGVMSKEREKISVKKTLASELYEKKLSKP